MNTLENTKRPWQSIVLIVILTLNIISAIFGFLSVDWLLNLNTGAISPAYNSELSTNIILIVKIFLIFIIVFQTFIIWKIYQGKKWAATAMLILSFLGLIGGSINGNMILHALAILNIYLSYTCLKHPFFNQNKTIEQAEDIQNSEINT